MKFDPIIAVADVEASSKWYQSIFALRSMHGGSEFDVLVDANDEIFLCLHKWGEHNHPTLTHANVTPGNGLILYFRSHQMNEIRERVKSLEYPVDKEIALNPNSDRKEFSLRDPDGYYLTISDYHDFTG